MVPINAEIPAWGSVTTGVKPVSELDYSLFSTDQIKQCEAHAAHLYNLNEYQLMLHAGTEAFAFLRRVFPKVRCIAVFCGSGNNAGDGYIVARLAHQHGLNATVYQCTTLESLPDVARHAALEALAAGVAHQSADDPLDSEVELIIDALLGTGLKGMVYGAIAVAIEQINASGLPVVSLDIPSGLHADTGVVGTLCVQALMTFTFIGRKVGMYTLDGPDYCGAIVAHTLGLDACLNSLSPYAYLVHDPLLSYPLPKRRKNSHKGTYGHVVIIGGGSGMPGSVALAAKAAMRVGAGSVSIATRSEHVSAVLPLVPEAMVWGIDAPEALQPLLAQATFGVLGPGLGTSDWAKGLFSVAMSSQLPMVIDASGLRLLAEDPQMDDNWILTPHPGEAAGLLSCSTQDVQAQRGQAAALIQQQYGGVVVLKGTGTIIQTLDKKRFICPKGNPGMATAGMGDVLSGVIAGLCAQGISLSESAVLGVWAHAVAADLLAQEQGELGIVASDLLDRLPKILSRIDNE